MTHVKIVVRTLVRLTVRLWQMLIQLDMAAGVGVIASHPAQNLESALPNGLTSRILLIMSEWLEEIAVMRSTIVKWTEICHSKIICLIRH